jgi:hypothetical protein
LEFQYISPNLSGQGQALLIRAHIEVAGVELMEKLLLGIRAALMPEVRPEWIKAFAKRNYNTPIFVPKRS